MVVEQAEALLKRKGSLAQQLKGRSSSLGEDSGVIGSTQFATASSSYVRRPCSQFDSGVASPAGFSMSTAGYAASEPFRDVLIQEAVTTGSRPHTFAAVITCSANGHGGNYLRRHLYQAVTQKIAAEHGDVIAGFMSAIAQLDLKFKALHIQKGGVLAGTQIAAAYIDLSAGCLSLFSNGGCCAAVASTDSSDCLLISHEVGRGRSDMAAAATQQSAQQKSAAPAAPKVKAGSSATDFSSTSIPISLDMDHIILGSSGLWQELPAERAAFRVASLAAQAPHALAGNSAAAVTQLALQSVATRTSTQLDPRMAVLRDVDTLQQLWTGSQRNFRWGGRQPLRRRRGDVHGDLSSIVLRLDWAGSEALSRSAIVAKKMCAFAECTAEQNAVLRSPSGGSIHSATSFSSLRLSGRASHWDLIRSHFMSFRPAARAAARARWYSAVAAAVDAPADHPIKLQAAERRSAAAADVAQQHIPPHMAAAAAPHSVPQQSSAAAPERCQSAAAAEVAAAEPAEIAARRRSIAGVSRKRLDLPAGSVSELTPSRTMRSLSRLINASKTTFIRDSAQPVLIH